VVRILVVDDEPLIARLACEALAEEEGFEAMPSDGLHALATMRDFSPDVVLLDLLMPTVDGVEVARLMRADPALASIPIVVVTALYRVDIQIEQIKPAAMLAKPFDLDDLLDAIALALCERQSE
jgi:DNA-binding response OmpR family regulator